MTARQLATLAREIEGCRTCPRLTEHREAIGRTKRRAYAAETYWAKPVPGFGDPEARLVLVGLAPGAHGANRTGRMFTGDGSGDFLYPALHRAGVATQPASTSRDDGLELVGAFITTPCCCAPPDNHPTREELTACKPFLVRELAALVEARTILALGAIALRAIVDLVREAHPNWTERVQFEHGLVTSVPNPFSGPARGRSGRPTRLHLVASYHVSRQNTQTGRLTAAMFEQVLATALGLARGQPTSQTASSEVGPR